jgi:hypothetical protein
MQPKLVITFKPLSEAEFQAKVGHILSSLTGNPHFPEPWPEPVPSLAQINAAYQTYLDAYHASLNRDSLKIRQRDAAREALTDLLKRLASYLELVAHHDTDKLLTTGFDLRKDVVRGIHAGTLPAPDNFWVEQSPKSGAVLLHVARMAGAKLYEVQITQADPSVEENWKPGTSSTTASHILIEGLTPAQTYWFRIHAIGSGGPGLWTDPISLIVV